MMEVVKAIQQSAELCQMLDEVAQDWREDAVIHGDLRWDNCQVLDPPSPGRPFGVTFVDWEAAGVGDACWDVGTVFSQCLVFWLLSTPLLRDRPPEAFAGLARSPLTRIRPAMRAFWRAYLRASKLETGVHGECLWRSMRYAGARLVQTAYEQMRWEIELTADMIYLLQLSLNVLHRPLEAAVQLLGIPVVSGAVR
jgi:aminoglycoside phosphotransferase (APT) family kinase protein